MVMIPDFPVIIFQISSMAVENSDTPFPHTKMFINEPLVIIYGAVSESVIKYFTETVIGAEHTNKRFHGMDQLAILMIVIIFEYCGFNIYDMSFLGSRIRCITLNGTF